MSESGTNQTVMRMFVLVAVFILLFGGAAVYAAYQTKQLKTELEDTKAALEACEGKVE
jgi:CHASE3 domain sensor protein